VIFLMLIIFSFSVYAGGGDSSDLYGSPGKVYKGLEKASLHGFTMATSSNGNSIDTFAGLGTFIENAGTCYKNNGGNYENTNKQCSFAKRGLDAWCCQGMTTLNENKYCRASGTDCIDISPTLHYESEGCDVPNEVCVTSFATMNSPSGLLFGITNIVGNFGTVFVDQSYWQSAVAAKPKSAVLGFLIGGMVWFAVPFCMATTNGLVGRALTTHPDLDPDYITASLSGSGLTPARALSKILGTGGAAILLLQLFMAITSTGSAEIIAVASILTYDIYYAYINPELKSRRESLRQIFRGAVSSIDKDGEVALTAINGLMDDLVSKGFFEKSVPQKEVGDLAAAISSFSYQSITGDHFIPTNDLYNCVNRAVCSNSIEGIILLRVSKFFTAVFAIFMGFLAVFLQTLGFSLGWVYMSMGVIIGSAVGPASLTILMETANSIFIGAGAIGGLILGLMGWCIKASVDNDGVVDYNTLGQDWPWVVGNLCAIIGGLLIALVGSLAMPDKSFKWEMLNERIPLVDDIEPPKDADAESDSKLQKHVKIAVGASLVLTFVLLVLWPLPMHYGGGVFSEGGFTVWVVLEMLWAIVGGIVIIGLPLVETVTGFISAKKQREEQTQKGAALSNQLPDSSTLIIPWKGGLDKSGLDRL